MKCPHCDYVDGWDSEKNIGVKGKDGGFYVSPLKMERETYPDRHEKKVFGCPACKKVFLDNTW